MAMNIRAMLKKRSGSIVGYTLALLALGMMFTMVIMSFSSTMPNTSQGAAGHHAEPIELGLYVPFFIAMLALLFGAVIFGPRRSNDDQQARYWMMADPQPNAPANASSTFTAQGIAHDSGESDASTDAARSSAKTGAPSAAKTANSDGPEYPS